MNQTTEPKRYSCEYCGCDVSQFSTLGRSLRWVDTLGNTLCPSGKSMFHVVNPMALPVVRSLGS